MFFEPCILLIIALVYDKPCVTRSIHKKLPKLTGQFSLKYLVFDLEFKIKIYFFYITEFVSTQFLSNDCEVKDIFKKKMLGFSKLQKGNFANY